jgi:hypothetical protein
VSEAYVYVIFARDETVMRPASSRNKQHDLLHLLIELAQSIPGPCKEF